MFGSTPVRLIVDGSASVNVIVSAAGAFALDSSIAARSVQTFVTVAQVPSRKLSAPSPASSTTKLAACAEPQNTSAARNAPRQ